MSEEVYGPGFALIIFYILYCGHTKLLFSYFVHVHDSLLGSKYSAVWLSFRIINTVSTGSATVLSSRSGL